MDGWISNTIIPRSQISSCYASVPGTAKAANDVAGETRWPVLAALVRGFSFCILVTRNGVRFERVAGSKPTQRAFQSLGFTL